VVVLLFIVLVGFTSRGASALLQLDPAAHLTRMQVSALIADQTMTSTVVEQLWAAADAAWHEGDYREAIAIERNIVALDPKDTEAWEVMSWLAWTEYGDERAVEILQEGLKAVPELPELWEALAIQHFRMKRYEDAVVMYQQAIQRGAPLNTWKMLAHVLEKSGKSTEAIPVRKEIVRRWPDDVPARNNYHRLLAELGQEPAGVQ